MTTYEFRNTYLQINTEILIMETSKTYLYLQVLYF